MSFVGTDTVCVVGEKESKSEAQANVLYFIEEFYL